VLFSGQDIDVSPMLGIFRVINLSFRYTVIDMSFSYALIDTSFSYALTDTSFSYALIHTSFSYALIDIQCTLEQHWNNFWRKFKMMTITIGNLVKDDKEGL
jgi:hypothetical protein